MIFIGTAFFYVFLIFVCLGNPRTWPPLNRWSALIYAGFAACIALEFMAAWLMLNLSEGDGASGLAKNVAIATRNLHLARQSAHFTMIGTYLFSLAAMIHWLKVRRPAS